MKELKENQDLNEILGENLTIVDYYASWCGPCNMLAMELEDLDDSIQVVKVNTDDHKELAQSKGVMSIPFVEIYKDKQLVSSFLGFKTKEEIDELLKNI